MWAIVFLLVNVIWNKVDARYINIFHKGKATSQDDAEFAKLEKRQQITGELEINGKKFESLGCWRDAWTRGLPTLEGEHYLLMDPNYKGRRHALFKCARAAVDKGLKVFGIENGGQCFASAEGEKQYRKYGVSKECKVDGKGGPWSLQVYSFADPRKTINGDYSEWSPWTQCSKSCTGGVRRRMRKCSNPPPSNGGQDCRSLGPSVESQDCNVKLCSEKFTVGTPESHTARSINGAQVRQFTGAGSHSPLPPKNSGQNGGNQEEYQTNNQHMGQPIDQKQHNGFNSNSNPNKVEEKYIPMSREGAKNFKQVASFQKSVSNPGQVSDNAKEKDTSKSPGIPNKDLAVEGNALKQPMPSSANPLPLRHEKGHTQVWSENLKPSVHDHALWKDEKGSYPSASASTKLNTPPSNHMGPVEGAFQIQKTKEPSMSENSINGGYNELGQALKETNGRVDDGSITSPSNGEYDHIKSNKMNAAENAQNPKAVALIGEPLKARKPGFPTEKAAGFDNQEQKFPQQHSDNFENSLGYNHGIETKPNGKNTPTQFHTFHRMDNHPEDWVSEYNKPPATMKEHFQHASTDSSHMPVKGDGSTSSLLQSSTKEKQTTLATSNKADFSKGQEPHEHPIAALQEKPMASILSSKAIKQVNGFTQQKLSDKEKQDLGKKPAEASPMTNKFKGPLPQHGGQVGNSNHFSTTGNALSMTKENPTGGMSPQQVQTNPKIEHDVGHTLQQKYPQQGHELNKLTPSGEEHKLQLHQTTEGDQNGKVESHQEQAPNEGEPVPMMDLTKGGALSGTDYGPTTEEGFPGPSEDAGMHSQSQGDAGDYGPENGDGFTNQPGEDTGGQSQPMPDAIQQSRPTYDNEAIQGISDLAQKEDQNILQQVNSAGQAGSDGGMGVGYDDNGMSQAYTGETSKGENQDELERTEDEMTTQGLTKQEESNSSLVSNGQSQERYKNLASDYYDTEPAEDCLCPKKECSAKADVAFLVDGSANIPLPYYARVLEFIKIFSRGFDKSNTHVGLMAYGDNVKTALNLKGINDFKEFDDAVNIAPYIGGKAFTGNALLQMKTALFAISGRQDAPRALILLSSGGSADDVVAPGEELRDSGVKVTAIGLGKQANVRELINIASEPKSEHVFTAFLDTLPNAMDDIIQGVCRDVMGIVRDRQLPCTCETYNGQVGPSSDYSKESPNKEAQPTGPNPNPQQDNGLSQNNEQSESTRIPYSQGENLSHQFQAQASYHHDNNTEDSQLTDASSRPKEEGHLVYNQQGEHPNGVSRRPAEIVSSGYDLSETDSRNEQHSQNHGAVAGELNHEGRLMDTQGQQSRPREEHHAAVTEDESREEEENSIGTDDYSTGSEEGRKFHNGGQNEREDNTHEYVNGSEVQRFSAGLPEHYQPHGNADGYKADTSSEKPLTQDTSRENANKQSPRVDDTLNGTRGPQGDSFPSTTFSHERVQGSGSHVHPTFVPSPSEDNRGEKSFEEANYPEGYSKEQGELSSDYNVPAKVIAVGKAAENYKSAAQEEDRHECGRVHLGVVLDSSASEGHGKPQATKMMDLAKQVSHLFPVSPDGNSVGMVVYGGSPQPSVVHFDKFLDQKSMDEAIDNASNPSLEIRIGKALTLAQKHLFSQLSASKHNVLLLVTDGFSTDDVGRPAIELKRRGIEVFCLGVGSHVNKTQLDSIASEPTNNHVFLAPFNDADTLMERIQKEICQSATRSARLQTQRKCPSDLGFVIDGARSVEVLGKGNFKKMLEFVKNVSLGFHIAPEGTRVGAITYGTEPILEIPFNKSTSPKDLALAIENIKYPGTITMTGKALALANQKLFDKGSRINVPKVLVVLSEGSSRDNVQPSAQALHKAGVTVISVGLGQVYNTGELNDVASLPAAYHVIKAKFNQLQHKVNELQDKICQAKQIQNKSI